MEILKTAEIDESEKEYILEYYSLVKEGKTNYVSTHSFQLMFGQKPMQPTEFFQTYDEEFKPKRFVNQLSASSGIMIDTIIPR